ncbi:hypothetical protein ACFQ48_00765 [Hymenobacter caeli]|uniref:Spy/CpxP family protein refolding chaperone n=1 Tax=Hymenobacter caeli TaxID=2735894 RepID=A0ABX2FJR9_9BACT|nr:hypothetical protein [Hymenobacter caeli]NRT17352.1 Spy/CpxP family protein refolding chaperone [Hymenobacter caeli]
MKKFLFPLLAAFALSAGAAQAQAPAQGAPGQMAARQTERLTQALGLSADQTTKVQAIMAARDQEMQGMRGQVQSGSVTREQMRDQMMAGRAKYDDQFKAVLTPDQYTKYTAMQAERMQRGGQGMAQGQGMGQGMAQDSTAKKGKVKIKKDKLKAKVE